MGSTSHSRSLGLFLLFATAVAAAGDIVAMMRTEPALGSHLWAARSSDRGRTWSRAIKTPLQGHPAHLLRLRDGRLLCTYGFRDAPSGIRATLSRDDSRGAMVYNEGGGIAWARFNDERKLVTLDRIPVPFCEYTCSLADLDRDGRLDLVVDGIDQGHGAVAVLKGREGGLAPPEVQAIRIAIISRNFADLDGDGFLELLIAGRGGWASCPIQTDGSIDFAYAMTLAIDYQIQRVTVADLNGDDWPEVIAARYRQMSTRRNAIKSAVYWNRRGRFTAEGVTTHPTLGAHWVSVAPATNPDRLDLLFSNYHAETMRSTPLIIYPSDGQCLYSANRRALLPAFSSSADMVANLNGDGWRDIVVFNIRGLTCGSGLSLRAVITVWALSCIGATETASARSGDPGLLHSAPT